MSHSGNTISGTHRGRHERSKRSRATKLVIAARAAASAATRSAAWRQRTCAGGMRSFKLHAASTKLSATHATTRAAVARVTWGTTTDALAAAVEAFRAAAGCRVGWLFEVEIHIFEVENPVGK